MYVVVVDMKIPDVERMKETKTGQKGGKDGGWREK